jgi:hypothetical protein
VSGHAPSWDVFDRFVPPTSRVSSWRGVDELVDLGATFARAECADLRRLVERWDAALAPLGGDPSRTDWTNFRPLRTEREEDWSDWLAHFIATSTTGLLARQLFTRNGFDETLRAAKPEVVREDATEDRRADLIITWGTGDRTQVEVKVGDLSLDKTYDTAVKLQKKYASSRWTHYLLLPLEDRDEWNAVEASDEATIHVFTWDDVALALRRCLRLGHEGHQWNVWASGFCGLVEQKLLGLPQATSPIDALDVLGPRVRQIGIMKRGLEDE